MTPGVLDAKDLVFYVNGTAISSARDAQLLIRGTMKYTSNRHSSEWREFAPENLMWEGSGSNLFSFSDSNGFTDLFTLFVNFTKFELRFSTEVVGDKRLFGDCYFTRLEPISKGTGDNVTYDFAFQGTGPLDIEEIT